MSKRGTVFRRFMISGGALSALVFCGVIAMSVRSCQDYCEFTPMIISAYVMIGGAIIAGIMALAVIIGGITVLFVPKDNGNPTTASTATNEPAAGESI